MASKVSLTTEVISQAESYNGVRAGIVRLKDILKGPSYQVTPEGSRSTTTQLDDAPIDDWPSEAQTVLVLGLNHPENDLRLDYWERGDTWGNRRLSGIGIIGRNNLLLNPEWGPRIRLHSILIEGDFQTTEALEGFTPCDTCEVFCQKACPMKAFPQGKYNWSICVKLINANVKRKVPDGEIGENGKRNLVIKYCRVCELSCPVGA